MYVPPGGLEAAHLAETIAAVALNAAFGAISTIHVLFEAAHNKGNKGCALVRSLGRLSHLPQAACRPRLREQSLRKGELPGLPRDE